MLEATGSGHAGGYGERGFKVDSTDRELGRILKARAMIGSLRIQIQQESECLTCRAS